MIIIYHNIYILRIGDNIRFRIPIFKLDDWWNIIFQIQFNLVKLNKYQCISNIYICNYASIHYVFIPLCSLVDVLCKSMWHKIKKMIEKKQAIILFSLLESNFQRAHYFDACVIAFFYECLLSSTKVHKRLSCDLFFMRICQLVAALRK